MQEQTETKPALPCSADAASPLDNYPTGKLFLSSSSFSCQQTSSSCLVTFPSIPTGLFPFLEVVHNSRKDKVEGEGEQVLSVQPHSVTEASSLILPSPQEQSTDSPDDHPINTAGTAETEQCAVPWAGDSQRVKPTSRSWNYAQLDVAKDSGDGTSSFKKFTSYLPYPHQLLFYLIPWLSSCCWEVLGCRGCCSTVKGILRQAQGLSTLPATHTGTHTTGLVQPAKDSRVHELLGWTALAMKGDIRIFEGVYHPSTVIPGIQSH